MRKRLIVACALVLVLTNVFCVSGTFAWFTSSGDGGKGAFDSGVVRYVPSGAFENTAEQVFPDGTSSRTGDLIVPGQVMLAAYPLTLRNESNVPTRLKVELSYTFRQRPAEPGVSSAPEEETTSSGEFVPQSPVPETFTGILDYHMGAGWKLGRGAGEDTAQKQVLYYDASPGEPADLANQGMTIPVQAMTEDTVVIQDMKLAESYPGFDIHEQLIVTVAFYARQDDYVTSWDLVTDYTVRL